jgi:hypothetical protein
MRRALLAVGGEVVAGGTLVPDEAVRDEERMREAWGIRRP